MEREQEPERGDGAPNSEANPLPQQLLGFGGEPELDRVGERPPRQGEHEKDEETGPRFGPSPIGVGRDEERDGRRDEPGEWITGQHPAH